MDDFDKLIIIVIVVSIGYWGYSNFFKKSEDQHHQDTE